MKRMLLAIAGAALLATLGSAAAQSSDPYLGEIITVPYNFCPSGWADMNGQLLPIAQNQGLFSLLGTTYGGNGQTNFALPTGKPQFTATGIPLRQCIALEGVFPPID